MQSYQQQQEQFAFPRFHYHHQQQQQQQQQLAYCHQQPEQQQSPAYNQGGFFLGTVRQAPSAYIQSGLVHSLQGQGSKTHTHISPPAHNTRASTTRARLFWPPISEYWNITESWAHLAYPSASLPSAGFSSADFAQAQALPVAPPPPAIQQPAAPRGGIQKKPKVAAGKGKRGRPRADDRRHGEEPSGDAAAMVRVAWDKAEANYHRLRSAKKRLEEYEGMPEAKKTSPGEKTRMEKCEAVAALEATRTGTVFNLLPATNVAEQELARREEVLANRERKYREARGPQDPCDSLKDGELAWHSSARNQVEEQGHIVEACRERDRYEMALRA